MNQYDHLCCLDCYMMLYAIFSSFAIPLAALIVSAASLLTATLLSARTYAKAASSEWVETLEKHLDLVQEDLTQTKAELADAERKLEECRRGRERLSEEIKSLRDREVDLLRRIVKLENGT